MKKFACFLITFVVGVSALGQAPSAGADASVKEKLIGAWRLAWTEEQGPDGKMNRIVDRKGTLVYSRDGHMSVQIMLPKQGDSPQGNPVQYDRGGYEAYYGTYEVNEQTHSVTHHVEGALVRTLVGKDLTRVYHFEGRQLILKSSRADEHWTIAWEHY